MGKLKLRKSLENKRSSSSGSKNNADEISKQSSNKEAQKNSNLEREVNTSKTNELKKKDTAGLARLVSKVRFKKAKSENKLLKAKTSDKLKKDKYEAIKDDLLKQVKSRDDHQSATIKQELVVVNKKPLERVTNAVIKSILKTKNLADKTTKTNGARSSGQSFPNVEKQIKKKEKKNLKKEIWNKKIQLIKKESQENLDRAKREKTVITGDIKPIMESLNSIEQSKEVIRFLNDTAKDVFVLTKRQKSELNKERQQSKSIQRESIRNKKAQEDVSLFGQLLGYNEFVQNPIETLKKINK